MEEYERKFLELLKYVDYIKDEKAKIQRFLSGSPTYYKDKIQYDEPRYIEATIRKAKYLYEKSKGRSDLQRSWRHKKKDKQDQRKKGFRLAFFRGNSNTFQPNKTSQSGTRTTMSLGKRPRKSSKFWRCGGDHMVKDCPQQGSRMMTTHNIQEATIVDDVGGCVPKICVTLDNRQA